MIHTKEDLKMYMKADKKALGISKKRPNIFGDLVWKFEIVLRLNEFHVNNNHKIRGKIYSLLHSYYGIKLGFSIPCNVFGMGLRINHYGLIVVNPKAKIGDWCDIHQGVNIGTGIEPDTVPEIGNNVYIAPGVKMFGAIKIGDNTMIGANSVVTKSFPEGDCRIAGIPAKIISNEPNCYKRSL